MRGNIPEVDNRLKHSALHFRNALSSCDTVEEDRFNANADGDKIHLVVFYCLHTAMTRESPRCTLACMERDIRTDYGCLISHLLNVYDIQISRKEIYERCP